MKAMAQARTDAQASTARGLMVLGDDCVHKVMTFLAVADARRGVGAANKSLRTTATSTSLSRARFCEPYTLRGDKHGVVHALATAFGTRRWPTRAVALGLSHPRKDAAVPPARLLITINRQRGGNDEEPYASCIASAIVDPDLTTKRLSGGGECYLTTGSSFQYDIPYQLIITAFAFGVSDCRAKHLIDWKFEAFDGEEWRELYYSSDSPWSDDDADRIPQVEGRIGNHRRKVFLLPGAADFASTRFRIRLAQSHEEERCMHIRGLELFGTILPPWRID